MQRKKTADFCATSEPQERQYINQMRTKYQKDI